MALERGLGGLEGDAQTQRFVHKKQPNHGGATTSGPDATHPPAIWGGGGQFGGGRLEGVGGGGSAAGGVPKVGGPARDPLLPHAYLLGGCVSGGLGDGLMKRKHTLKKGGAVGAMPPAHYLSKPWGGGGLGGGGVAYKDRAGLPPPGAPHGFPG